MRRLVDLARTRHRRRRRRGRPRARTGTVAEGLAAYFLLVDITTPELTLSWDVPWELVRRGNRDQITAVFVAGELRLWRGLPTGWDGPAFVRQAAELARAAVERAPITRVHPTSAAARQRSAAR